MDSDGTSEAETEADLVGSSGNPPPGTQESATFVEPEIADGRLAPGDYVARVVNYAAPLPDPYELTVEFAGPGEDKLKGGGGKDRLSGGAKADRLKGGPGRDRLGGGNGRDRLDGGPGRDRCKGGPKRDRMRRC